MELLNNLSVFKRNRRNMYAFDLYSIFGTVHFGNQSLGGVSYWNNFTCSALAQSREQRWRIGMLLRDTQKGPQYAISRSEEHTSELQSRSDLVCRLLLEKKKDTRQ